jgi:hypothetical protein
MIKDPYHQEETPYDILSLEPFATHKEVQGALTTFMRDLRKRARLPMAQKASKALKKSRTRLEVDLLYYCIGRMDENLEEIDLGAIESTYSKVPVLSIDDLYSDLIKEDYDDDLTDIQHRQIKLSEIKKYDDIGTYKMDFSLLPFDL